MDKLKTAKEIGLRCRRFRNALGLSQDALGEKVGILGATISKYEREGIYDIEKIQELSQALGHDLLMDEVDQEGTVGEIGKEILHILIDNEGYIRFEDLVNYKMYGMTIDRVTNEVFKLEKIGMCVREQYKDWKYKDVDNVFITAKGIITYKNMQLNESLANDLYEALPRINSYESIIGDYDSYQQYIDNNEVERLVRSIDYDEGLPYFYREDYEDDEEEQCDIFSTCHRINYVKYLKKEYETSIDNEDEWFGETEGRELVTGINIYHDILYRMSLKITNKMIYDEIICSGYSKIDEIFHYFRSLLNEDPVIGETISSFKEEFEIDDEDNFSMREFQDLVKLSKKLKSVFQKELDDIPMEFFGITRKDLETKMKNDDMSDISEEDYSAYEEAIRLTAEKYEPLVKAMEDKINTFAASIVEEPLDLNRPEGASVYPIDWFTDEEIREFISENFGPAETEEDKRLDEILKRINELCPESLDYYRFPQSWEENGLANLIRKNCGLEIPAEEDFDNDNE